LRRCHAHYMLVRAAITARLALAIGSRHFHGYVCDVHRGLAALDHLRGVDIFLADRDCQFGDGAARPVHSGAEGTLRAPRGAARVRRRTSFAQSAPCQNTGMLNTVPLAIPLPPFTGPILGSMIRPLAAQARSAALYPTVPFLSRSTHRRNLPAAISRGSSSHHNVWR